ncbi:MAG: ion channel [Spirochaetes bacterium]|nr:ion channel [Spirochaetota bacterium]
MKHQANDERGGIADWFQRNHRRFSILLGDITRSSLPKLVLVFFVVTFVLGTAVFLIERTPGDGMFRKVFDGIWWAFVTIGTVGYGDKVPVSDMGKAVGIVLILAGVVLTSLISGTVASIFVERRIREGKGLQSVKGKNHIIIGGWNEHGSDVLSAIGAAGDARNSSIVLLNMMEPEQFDALRARHPALDVRFVRGDHTQEAALKRASAQSARACIFLPDSSGENSLTNADERTVLACFAIKSINSETEVCAEILKPENEQHLKRAGIDDIIVNGEFSGFLLSSAAVSVGIPQAARSILSPSLPSRLRRSQIPQPLVGKPFVEASEWYLRNGKGVLIGVISHEKQMSLDDLLSDDASAIDAFIKRKFQEAEFDLAGEMKGQSDVKINPGPDYVIKDSDVAFVVG